MDRKTELRNKALDYCLAHGVADVSLRPLAKEIGTSARLLIYHFASRDGLMVAVMDELQGRVQRSFSAIMAAPGHPNLLRAFWNWTTDPCNERHLRLMYEVQMLALRNPAGYAHFLQANSANWLELIEQALPRSSDRRIRATLCAAVIDGLLLEFWSTGDLRRTGRALDLFKSMLGGVGAHPESIDAHLRELNS